MKLEGKKQLVERTFGVGKSRILFNQKRLAEVKEAITKQDIRDLVADGAIIIKEISGTLARKKRKTRRRAGSIKVKVRRSKKDYISLTRKLRRYLSDLKEKSKISQSDFENLRKQIRASEFRSLTHMKERIAEQSQVKKQGTRK